MHASHRIRAASRGRFPGALALLLLAVFAVPARAGGGDEVDAGAQVLWDARAAEHLLNRAGFGARKHVVEHWAEQGQEALVEHLLTRTLDVEIDPYFVEIYQIDQEYLNTLDKKGKDEARARIRRQENRQLAAYSAWWMDRMLAGLDEDPLRERMALFWHGHFTTSASTVRRTYEVLRQHQMLREGALGNYGDLLRAIVRDPAMIYYLDNHQNKKGKPNENLARELMELFSLGEGNYTEKDVKEAARSLTGFTADRQGNFVFRRSNHDNGKKNILGEKGRFTGDQLVEILLRQEACADYMARKLVTYFEGVEPSDERAARYAALLRDKRYELKPFLRALFLDPDFYRDEVVGTRVQSPVDFLVGTSLRLGLQRVPAGHLVQAAGGLGQRLFHPPNVKGWEGGMAWITTSTFMQRGNVAGLLVGAVDGDSLVAHDDPEMLAKAMEAGPSMMDPSMDASMEPSMEPSMADEPSMMEPAMDGPAMEPERDARKAPKPRVPDELKAIARMRNNWDPNLNFSQRLRRAGAVSDGEIVDYLVEELLGVPIADSTRAALLSFLSTERAQVTAPEGWQFREGMGMELVLRRLAHQILSLPEAQLS